MARTKRAAIHYVNNKEFSQAVVDYTRECQIAEENNKELPIVPNYIAECFMKIAEGLSHKPNFIRYTYREEMVMDAVENCLKAVQNYNIDAATRTGNPNAFAYFTQISWYAFLRRIEKEKKQHDVKERFLTQAGIETLVANTTNPESNQVVQMYVDELRSRIDKIKDTDAQLKEFKKKEKKERKKRVMKISDIDLTNFEE